jgi:hypothetical protein
MNGRRTREQWLALPPKRCPGCDRTLPRSAFYPNQHKCKPCYTAARVANGSDSASRYQKQRQHRASEPQVQRRGAAAGQLGADPVADQARTGVDFMELAQHELFPGRAYTALTREECGAVRRRALELFAAPEAKSA